MIRIRHFTIDDPVDAAERDAIADEAPERNPKPATGEGVWLDEPNQPKQDEWI
jgi:hypothetical protein